MFSINLIYVENKVKTLCEGSIFLCYDRLAWFFIITKICFYSSTLSFCLESNYILWPSSLVFPIVWNARLGIPGARFLLLYGQFMQIAERIGHWLKLKRGWFCERIGKECFSLAKGIKA